MSKLLDDLLCELECFGLEQDSKAINRSEKLLNITRDTGEFLSILIKAAKVTNILEVGTSNGYSTLWLASALPALGSVTTVEISSEKIVQAENNFKRAGCFEKVQQIHSDANDFFKHLTRKFDFIFLDAERTDYMGFSNAVVNALMPGGILVCDNAISHAAELNEFILFIKNHSDFCSCIVPVGKGEFVAYKQSAEAAE